MLNNLKKAQGETADVWEKALTCIESSIGSENVETWFQPVRLEEMNGSKATIIVPNRFFGDWLETKYRQVIIEALQSVQSVGEGEIDVEFVVNEQAASRSASVSEKEPSPLPSSPNRIRRQAPNPKYTFENFVVGASNQFAHAASLAVADVPADRYNPLFICGGVGLGKTHLLHSIGNLVMGKGDLRIAYVTTEQFTNEVINSIRHGKMEEFRRRYRNTDMLLIDDIQFLARKEQTQEEFFHTFNTLYEAQKQIVLSSDRFPKEMPSMEERLTSRFEWGLTADLQQPDVETRMAILRKKSEEEGIAIGDEIVQLLAESLKNNIRELEGALIRLGAYATLTGRTISIEMAKNILPDLLGRKRKIITMEDVQEVVARRFQMKVSELKSKRRTKTLVYPRQIAMFLSRELTDASFPEIGREFGGKDHTTIIHACRQIEKAVDKDHAIQTTINSLRDEIGNA